MRQKARLFPSHFDPARLNGIRSLREFDDRVTAYYCGFNGADDYYDRASAAHVVGKVSVPTLILHAANDPFIRITPETRQKVLANPNIRFVEVEDGGHCAFIGARTHNGSKAPNSSTNIHDDGFWAETEIVNFLSGIAQSQRTKA